MYTSIKLKKALGWYLLRSVCDLNEMRFVCHVFIVVNDDETDVGQIIESLTTYTYLWKNEKAFQRFECMHP